MITLGLAIYAIRTFSVEEYGHFAIALAADRDLGLGDRHLNGPAAVDVDRSPRRGELLGAALARRVRNLGRHAPLMLPWGSSGLSAEVIALLGIGVVHLFFRVFGPHSTLRSGRAVLVFPALFLALQAVVTGGAGAALISAAWDRRAS